MQFVIQFAVCIKHKYFDTVQKTSDFKIVKYQIAWWYFTVDTNYILNSRVIIGLGIALLANLVVNLLNLSSLDVIESILLLLTPAYLSAALFLSFLYPPDLFFLKVFVTTLSISVFFTTLFPSNRRCLWHQVINFLKVSSILRRQFYELESAALPEHQIALCFQSMSIWSCIGLLHCMNIFVFRTKNITYLLTQNNPIQTWRNILQLQLTITTAPL